MFIAHTYDCDCCGKRERKRKLFVSKAKADEAVEDFYSKYDTLKAVEAGENVKDIARIDVLFGNGDLLSLGCPCSSKDSMEDVEKMAHALQWETGLEIKYENGCKVHRQKKSDSCDLNTDMDFACAAAEADRHAEELLQEEAQDAPSPTGSKMKKRSKGARVAQDRRGNRERLIAPVVSSADKLPQNSATRLQDASVAGLGMGEVFVECSATPGEFNTKLATITNASVTHVPQGCGKDQHVQSLGATKSEILTEICSRELSPCNVDDELECLKASEAHDWCIVSHGRRAGSSQCNEPVAACIATSEFGESLNKADKCDKERAVDRGRFASSDAATEIPQDSHHAQRDHQDRACKTTVGSGTGRPSSTVSILGSKSKAAPRRPQTLQQAKAKTAKLVCNSKCVDAAQQPTLREDGASVPPPTSWQTSWCSSGCKSGATQTPANTKRPPLNAPALAETPKEWLQQASTNTKAVVARGAFGAKHDEPVSTALVGSALAASAIPSVQTNSDTEAWPPPPPEPPMRPGSPLRIAQHGAESVAAPPPPPRKPRNEEGLSSKNKMPTRMSDAAHMERLTHVPKPRPRNLGPPPPGPAPAPPQISIGSPRRPPVSDLSAAEGSVVERQPIVHPIESREGKVHTVGKQPFGTDHGFVDNGWDWNTGGTGGTADFGWNSKTITVFELYAKLSASAPAKKFELQHRGLGGIALPNEQEDCSEDLTTWMCALGHEECGRTCSAFWHDQGVPLY
jgi:hypothetical protein